MTGAQQGGSNGDGEAQGSGSGPGRCSCGCYCQWADDPNDPEGQRRRPTSKSMRRAQQALREKRKWRPGRRKNQRGGQKWPLPWKHGEPPKDRARTYVVERYQHRRSDPRARAETYEAGRARHPWRIYTGGIPARSTLWRWRAVALELAAMRTGAAYCCDLCFRPLRQIGELWLRRPFATVQNGRGWDLCEDCAETIAALMKQLTADPPWREDQPAWPEDRSAGRFVAAEEVERS